MTGLRELAVGDEVIVWPTGGRGSPYKAHIERIDGGKATIRPFAVALSKPAWASTSRARSVNLTSLSRPCSDALRAKARAADGEER